MIDFFFELIFIRLLILFRLQQLHGKDWSSQVHVVLLVPFNGVPDSTKYTPSWSWAVSSLLNRTSSMCCIYFRLIFPVHLIQGRINAKNVFYLTISCPMDFSNFPFDEHNCEFPFISQFETVDKVLYINTKGQFHDGNKVRQNGLYFST